MSEYRLPDGTVPVLLSSDTADGLRTEAARLLDYLEAHPAVTPDPVADMLFRTRTARRQRALAVVTTRAELIDVLRAVIAGTEHPALVAGTASARRVAFVFPGQGSQRPGMGRLYYELSQHYRDEVDACAEVHRERYGHVQPLHYLRGDEGGYRDEVWEVQPALMFHMAGLAALWQAAGVRPAATVGHSQGELAAGWVSGVMTRRDAVLAVTERALLVDKLSPRGYSMAVLGMDRESCEALLARRSGWAELAVINSPHILAVSGDRDTIVGLVADAGARGYFAKEIRVSYPAHTSLVAELRRGFQTFLDGEMSAPTFRASDIPCYGATLGEAITPELVHEDYWYWNLRNRVRFDRAVVAAAADGIDTFLEVSEHPMLQLAIQENLTLVPQDPALPPRDFRVLGTSLRTATGLSEFARNLATLAVLDLNYDWQALRTADTVRPPLPDFPHTVMGRQRLWLASGSAAAEQLSLPPQRRPQRLAEEWIRLDRRGLLPPRRMLVVDHTGRCAELAAALCTAAHNHGGSAWLSGDTTATDIDTVVVLLPESAETDEPRAVDELAEFFGAPDWLPDLTGVRDCWLLTVGGEAVTADDPAPHLFHGAVASGFRCVGMEQLGTAFRHLDLAAGQTDASAAAAIVRALHIKEEPELALRGTAVYAKRLEIDGGHVGDAGAQNLEHVVIIGGTGTLGVKFCEHYARLGARRITLVSRSGRTRAVERKLAGIRTDTEIVVTACDVSDPVAAAEFAATLAQRPASLVMHAAVNYVRAELAEVTAEKMRNMAGSKIFGTAHLLRELPRTPDCRIVLCSSIAATFGGRGQILYAAVNRMLDVLARRLRADGVDAVAVQWGLWDLAGPLHAVGVEPVEAAGVVAMAADDALTVGLAEHADLPGAGNRLVAAAEWADVRAIISAIGYGPLLERVCVAEASGAVGESGLESAGASSVDSGQKHAGIMEAHAGMAGAQAGMAGVQAGMIGAHAGTVGAQAGTVGAQAGMMAVDAGMAGAQAGMASADSGVAMAAANGGVSLAERVRLELGKVMGAEGAEALDGSVPLVALGLDSLQALEFRKRVRAELDRELPVAAILGGASLDDVVRLMAGNRA
ncbi:nocobactin polyketide synthase NbtC [Nocardia terpenica]|uniref:nocobactin polyketide synthase NbtC n=1 Tax=Nocardia terpenica TaxID=455432 RepID=UPI00189348E1|nr:nocobactin polyketide synthase NbtC [Nocardia terpenica]MBF6061635.1 nocobactin polyketide synthase NbtC [Nocardia terpenica]MBF6107570.1 nocobactin polyketide synthase NbtC [Nocardia terpenica]MBF6110055.1 nocobactin polyketide synthase NbtC [Nocardia terpenica]MBF6122433.1 nocobactin polyketide synthase NbtC [Nocardia terpenica]MBF6151391.1 nocobactin polyketide synthase NbtC [Nocardia terpenica]